MCLASLGLTRTCRCVKALTLARTPVGFGGGTGLFIVPLLSRQGHISKSMGAENLIPCDHLHIHLIVSYMGDFLELPRASTFVHLASEAPSIGSIFRLAEPKIRSAHANCRFKSTRLFPSQSRAFPPSWQPKAGSSWDHPPSNHIQPHSNTRFCAHSPSSPPSICSASPS